MTAVLSIADLERQIEERRNQVLELCQKRERVKEELERIDAELQLIGSGGAMRKSRRLKNSMPLGAHVTQILQKHKKGLSLEDLTSMVQQTGYASNSANFKGIVYQNLYGRDDVVKDPKSGLYKLNK